MSVIQQKLSLLSKGKSFLVGFGLAVGFMLGVGASGAGDAKVGYVDTDNVIAQLPDSKGVQEKMKKMQEGAEAEMQKMAKDLQAAFEEYERKKTTMTEDAKKKKEEELLSKRQQLEEFRYQKQNELQKKTGELLKPIEDKVMKAVEKVAKQYGYSIVLNKGGVANPVLYGDKTHDLTFKVLDALK
ncbi:MAG: OmpH family outer membrane protein [Chloroherpetonaceae bacterium]